MADDGRKLISDVTRGKSRRAPDVVQPGPPTRVRVRLSFERIDGAQTSDVEATTAYELEAGARYIVQVTLRRSEGANAVEIGDGDQISLKWQGGGLELPLRGHADPVHNALLTSQGHVSFEFALDVPEHTPITKGELQVRGGFAGESEVLRRQEIKITSRTHAAPKELHENLILTLRPDLRTGLAVLHIGESAGRLDIKGYHPSKLFSESFEKLATSLVDVDGEQPSRNVYRAVTAYSQNAISDLLAWLDEVLKRTQERVSLVIMERTESRVPWEMLVVENATAPLGARIPVTRWTDVTLFKDKIKLDPLARIEHQGSVLHFVDRQLSQSKIEIKALHQCENVRCQNVTELQQRLNDPPDDMALLFLSCHGTLSQDQDHSTELIDAKIPKAGIRALDLVELTTPAKRPAIIVNACHSARVARSAYGWSGLPNFFLAKYASSYFGTLGAVDEVFAAELGRNLIEAARSEQGVNLSQFLFDVRRNAWDKFSTTPHAKREYWPFVSAFMYVLYGPLENMMRLLPRKANGQ